MTDRQNAQEHEKVCALCLTVGGGHNDPTCPAKPSDTQNAREHTWDIESFEFDVCSVCGTVKNVNGNKPCTGTMPKVELRSDTQNDTSELDAQELRRQIRNITFDCFEGNIDSHTAAGFILNWIAQREQAAELRGRIDENRKWKEGTLSIHGDMEDGEVENIKGIIDAIADMHISHLKGEKHELPF